MHMIKISMCHMCTNVLEISIVALLWLLWWHLHRPWKRRQTKQIEQVLMTTSRRVNTHTHLTCIHNFTKLSWLQTDRHTHTHTHTRAWARTRTHRGVKYVSFKFIGGGNTIGNQEYENKKFHLCLVVTRNLHITLPFTQLFSSLSTLSLFTPNTSVWLCTIHHQHQ